MTTRTNEYQPSAMRFVPRLDLVRLRRRERQARAWVVRLDALPAADQGQMDQAFVKWLAKPGAESAFERASALWSEIDEAVVAQRIEAAKIVRWKARPKSLRMGRKSVALSLAASVAAAVWVGPQVWIAMAADARTGPFEMRRIALDDGSEVQLSSNSAIDVDYSRTERRVRLLQGQAAFKVAANRSRPFLVTAAGGETRALGTEFLVSWRDGGIVVSGIQHRVRVSAVGSFREIGPGDAVRYTRFSAPVARAFDPHAGDWRQGAYVAENKPLATIAAELERYSDRSIWILGTARNRRFNGVFRTADPIAGIRAAAAVAHLKITELPGILVVSGR